jgi:two-component system, OmpR family, response regulator MprA
VRTHLALSCASYNTPVASLRPQRVLVVDDDRAIREVVSLALELEGYAVTAVGDGEAALEARGAGVDLLLLDLGLPFVDGLSICRRLRERGDDVPILVLSGRSELHERVRGLEAGADDYLGKPFALEELIARSRALLRRRVEPEVGVTVVGDLRIDELGRRVFREDRELFLTRTEFDLLVHLAHNSPFVCTHERLTELLWPAERAPESNSLAVYVGYLRRKLEAEGGSRMLHTVRAIGYSLRA